MTTHHVDISEAAIRERVEYALIQRHRWYPTSELDAYMGLARVRSILNGHVHYDTYRIPLIGLDDPGKRRLLLHDAYLDALIDRYPTLNRDWLLP